MIAIESVAFWKAKRGNAESEWEDHFALDETTGRFAVADGASSSAKAAAWAATLTEGFLTDPFDTNQLESLDRWIDRRCLEFEETQPQRALDEVSADNWMQHAAAAQHGFATFIGATFCSEPGLATTCRWVGVGDSCLFHIRGGQLLTSAPVQTGDGFGTHPDLISSKPEHREQAVSASFRGEVGVTSGDIVLLVSDAMAEWALTVAPSEPVVWEVLAGIDNATFLQLVCDLRETDQMVNDDVTLARCRVMS